MNWKKAVGERNLRNVEKALVPPGATTPWYKNDQENWD